MFKGKFASRLQVILLAAMVLLASVLLVWNTRRLKEEADWQAINYVSDVSGQIAKTVENRIDQSNIILESISDSLVRSGWEGAEEVEEFLGRKARFYGFDSLVFLMADGTLRQGGDAVPEELASLSGVRDSFGGEEGVSFLDEKRILFSVPVERDGQTVGILGGVRSLSYMQSLIRADGLFGQSKTSIVGQDGSVIVFPEESGSFLELEGMAEGNGALAEEICQVETDMEAGRSGVLQFESLEGEGMVLSYEPLDHYSWFLLTLVPDSVFSGRLSSYATHAYRAVIGVIVVMAVILAVFMAGRRKNYEQLRKAAFSDPLTGRMNAAAFRLKCAAQIRDMPPGTYSMVMLNIKNFKLVNDTWGIEAGDQVLRLVMEALESCVGGDGFAARSTADHFFLCLKEGRKEALAERIREMTEEAGTRTDELLGGYGSHGPLVFQAGVFIIEDPSLDVTIMQDRARAACREQGRMEDGICKFYDSSIMEQLKREQELGALFEKSLEAGDFKLYLQPKVGVRDGKIRGAEALVRWNHPEEGLIPPSEFIPVFEKNGNICRLDLYMFTQVCRWMRERIDAGKGWIPVSVNLSRRHFWNPGCLEPFEKTAMDLRIPEKALEIELTESIFFDDKTIEDMKAWIREMHKMGFSCSLDDFGSGYSSLGLLAGFDVDVIKLDRRFFLDTGNPRVEEVVTSVTGLAHNLGIQTVAEGIEDEEQMDFVRRTGCDMVQGYYYSRPLPAEEFEEWLENSGCKSRG